MYDMNALRDWRFSIDPQGIAWAVFDREGESQNSLGQRPLEELAMIIERAEEGARDKTIRGLVFISGKDVRKTLLEGKQVDPRIMRESTSRILAAAMAEK